HRGAAAARHPRRARAGDAHAGRRRRPPARIHAAGGTARGEHARQQVAGRRDRPQRRDDEDRDRPPEGAGSEPRMSPVGGGSPAVGGDSAPERLREPSDRGRTGKLVVISGPRSEEHTSELQSRENLVCRLLLEKKKNKKGVKY